MRTGCKSESGLNRSEFNKTLPRRFLAKCGPVDSNGCIPWLGSKTHKGYGSMRRIGESNKGTTAHRVAWVLAHGDLPAGILVLHKCDNPSCVNEQHLFIGSPKANTEDMVSKGRHSWRDSTPWQKLDANDAAMIRDMRKSGCTQQKVADAFGVSRPLISMIENGHIQYAACV